MASSALGDYYVSVTEERVTALAIPSHWLAVTGACSLTSNATSSCCGTPFCICFVKFLGFLVPSTSSPARWPPATSCLLQLMFRRRCFCNTIMPLSDAASTSPSCRLADFPVASRQSTSRRASRRDFFRDNYGLRSLPPFPQTWIWDWPAAPVRGIAPIAILQRFVVFSSWDLIIPGRPTQPRGLGELLKLLQKAWGTNSLRLRSQVLTGWARSKVHWCSHPDK